MANALNPMPLVSEPLRKNRWILRFPSDIGIAEWTLTSAQRPSINQNSVEIPWLNTSTYVVGRYTWEPINVTLKDPIAPSNSQAVMEWVRLSSESVTGRQGYAAGYKRDLELELLDPTLVCVQKWILKNSWISNAKFGELVYSDDSLADITITLVQDYSILAY